MDLSLDTLRMLFSATLVLTVLKLAEATAIVDDFNRQFADVGVFHVATAEMLEFFEREIGVLQSPYGGKLRIVLGTEDGVLVKQLMPGEVFVVHTHPVVLTKKGHFDLDIPNSGKHIEAVIDWSGQMATDYHFREIGRAHV